MSCTICCEDYNNKVNRKIECNVCSESCCMSCVKRILKEENGEMRCVHCKSEFKDEDIMEKFGKSYLMREYKKHREEYLLKREKSLLPETQEFALRLKKKEEYDTKRKELMSKKNELMLQLHLINSRISALNRKSGQLFDKVEKKEESSYEYKCPMENCEGFLNHNRVCGLCEKKICKHCMEEKTEEHVCDEEKKETISLIRRDSKGCPKCGQMIYKIDGCDQMYCVRCHTGFSWMTGKIEKGRIHNPEYYRWMRDNNMDLEREENRLNQENRCNDGIIDAYELRSRLLVIQTAGEEKGDNFLTIEKRNDILTAHRYIHHAQVEINQINRYEDTAEEQLRELRAEFLIKKITEEEWKVKIQRIYKKIKKDERVKNIWNLLRLVLIEYMGKFDSMSEWSDPLKEVKEIHEDLKKIRIYVNEEWYKIGKLYKVVYGGIKINWENTRNWELYLKRSLIN